MADRKFDNLSGGIGDIGSLLHNQGVSDLSWLAVDEDTYRAAEALPRQNLDVIPELQKALTMQDDVPHVIPMKPHVIVNRNPLDSHEASKTDVSNPIRNRIARMVMEGRPPSDIKDRILSEFSAADVRTAASSIAEVVAERGVLGNVYVDAKHFPRCHQGTAEDKKFLASHAKRALYVLQKPECDGCVHNCDGRCASIKKTLVASVPYGPRLASRYAEQFQSEKRSFVPPDRSGSADWKSAIRTAFLQSPATPRPDGVQTSHVHHKAAASVVTKSDVRDFLSRKSAVKPDKPLSPGYVKYARRMMAGRDDREFLVASGDPDLVALSSEYGLLGRTWIDMDAVGSCKQAAHMIESMPDGTAPDFVVRRSDSCPHCCNTSDGGCSKIASVSRIVRSVPPYSAETFAGSLRRAVAQGRIASSEAESAVARVKDGSDWRYLTSQANTYVPRKAAAGYSGRRTSAWSGSTGNEVTRVAMNEDEVRRTISDFMNHGASGKALRDAVLNRYSKSDLSSFPDLGKRLASEDGIQGTYYIDPTAYRDYGSGCGEGASKFRKRGAPNVMASSSCTGCTLQTHPGWCSKYAKDLIRNVPDDVRTASKRRLPVVRTSSPIENPVERYELAAPVVVDVRKPSSKVLDISIGSKNIDG